VPAHVAEMWRAARGIQEDVRALILADRTNDGVRMQALQPSTLNPQRTNAPTPGPYTLKCQPLNP